MSTLTFERLHELLDYDFDTGVFTRKIGIKGRSAGSVAGTPLKSGHIKLQIDGVQYLAHRVAWLWCTGEWPRELIDHIDTDPANNRWGNMRDVNQCINMQNVSKATKRSKSGVLGVSWSVRRSAWQAQIMSFGDHHCLGFFPTKEEAGEVYLAAKRQLHEGCTA